MTESITAGLTITPAVDGAGAGLKSASFPAASVIPAPEMVAGTTVIPSTS